MSDPWTDKSPQAQKYYSGQYDLLYPSKNTTGSGDMMGDVGGGGTVGSSPKMPSIAPYTPSESYVAPVYKSPDAYVAPTYNAPTYDEGKVDTLTQRKSAAGLRAARSALQQISGGYYENPNVKRMTLRDALAGYGQAVENVMSGAGTEARNEYNMKYGIESDTAKTNFTTGVEGGKLNYNTSLLKSQQDYQGATSEAEKNYQSALDAEKLNYTTGVQTTLAKYNADLAAYMAQTYGTGATKYGSYSSTNDNSDAPSGNRLATRYTSAAGTDEWSGGFSSDPNILGYRTGAELAAEAAQNAKKTVKV